MKMFSLPMMRQFAVALTSAVCLSAFVPASAHAANEAVEKEFPYVIQPELGAAEFAPGDGIIITLFRGNRPHIEPGGRYLLEGTYTLTTMESAELAWFATARGQGGSAPVEKDEHVQISKGSGKFRLEKTLQGDGWLHVSLYVNGAPHGGVYFGEKGVEKTVLRQKGWSDFSKDLASKPNLQAGAGSSGSAVSDPANLAIIAFLGKPVPAPANLAAKYSPKNLEAAFTASSKKSGLQVQKLAVDDSEFPFLVYGVLAGKPEYRVLEQGLRGMKDYVYGGSVVGATDNSTYFALNMIPQTQIPSEQAAACSRRLMIRLQMLADAARQSE